MVRFYVVWMRPTKGCQNFLAIAIIVRPSEIEDGAKDGQNIPRSFVFKVAKHVALRFVELSSYFQITFIHGAFHYLERHVGDDGISDRLGATKTTTENIEERMVQHKSHCERRPCIKVLTSGRTSSRSIGKSL